MLLEEIKTLTSENKYPGGLARSATTAQPGNGKGIWTKVNPGCFIVGGYCHTHGYRIGKDHDSGLCSPLGLHHKREDTRANPMGGCKYFSDCYAW